MKKKLRDVKIGDKVIGYDGKPHTVLDLTPIHLPLRMFLLTFDNGKVKCSWNHQWHYYINELKYITDTLNIFDDFEYFQTVDFCGSKLLSIQEIKPEPVRCITTDTEDSLFVIYGED